jgi:chorismate mutase/prephenate dehydratase
MTVPKRIEALRQRIDALDQQLVSLLNERAACAREIGEAKMERDIASFAPAREQEVLRAVAAANTGPLTPIGLEAIYREIIAACRSLEHPIRVAYWGPPASNTHVAARQRFGPQAAFTAVETVADVFHEVERGRADFGVVPVENSTEGTVSLTLDMFLESSLRICAETYVQIHHHLLSSASALSEIRRVYTMPQATGQCRGWLHANLPTVELVDTSTTARAAEIAARETGAAAIANQAAADHYGLNVIAEQIEDNPRNRTRFLVLGALQPPPTGRDKTSLLFSLRHEAGALASALAVFAAHGLTLTMIESRPTKLTPWEYVFFIDLLGHVEGPEESSPVAAALREVEKRCLFVKLLGSYPEA